MGRARGAKAAPILGHWDGLAHTRPWSDLAKPSESAFCSACAARVPPWHPPCEYRNTSVSPKRWVPAVWSCSANRWSRMMPCSLIGIVRKWLMIPRTRLSGQVTRAICCHAGTYRTGAGRRSADRGADAAEVRPAGNLPVHPDADGMAYQVVIGDKAHLLEAAVLAVVAIVAHEEIVARRHDPLKVRGIPVLRQHDQVVGVPEGFLCQRRAAESIAAGVLSIGRERRGHSIDGYVIVAHDDVIARQADEPFDQVDGRTRG